MSAAVFILLASGLLVAGSAKAQDYPRKNMDAARLADNLFGFQDLDLDYDDLYENVLQLMANPVNLNQVSAEELRFFNILSEKQIQDFITYREENGPLLSVYELQAVPDFDVVTIHKILPFITVPDPAFGLNRSLVKRIWEEKNNYIITRYERTLETKKGYTPQPTADKRFKGSPDHYYLRFRTSRPGDFSLGLTAEKDAGEQFLFNPSHKQFLFDYISGHVQILNKGKLKNLVIGDYQFLFAQGLTLGGGFGMGKGGETITTARRSNIGFMPYTSTNESGLQRGIAATYALGRNLNLSAFLSRIKRDANLSDDENETITSIQATGLHRNDTELEARKRVTENNAGIVLQYHTNKLDAGVLFNYLKFGNALIKKSTPYNQFGFQGNENENIGCFINYNVSNFLFFSELARTKNGGAGGIAGVIGSLTPRLDIALSYRNYGKNFRSYYANAFSEGASPQNESGIYWGWKYKVDRRISLAGYVDLFRFPWLRYRSYAPSNGIEWLARINYQPSKQVLIFVQLREEKKVRNIDGSPSLYETAQGIKRNYWINFNYDVHRHIQMKTRAQVSTYDINRSSTSGFALIQDLSLNLRRFQITGRYALFDADDFDNRQYVYEQDVWLAYALPAYYGTGVRYFILLEYQLSKNITLWFRYTKTRYSYPDKIGSGLDEIDGRMRRDIKCQIRLKL